MTDIEISKLVLKEFREQTLAVTTQYLEIHEPTYEHGRLKIARIDRQAGDDIIVVYLPVKGEYFFFTVFLNAKTGKILSVDTEPRNLLSVMFNSANLTVEELQSMIKIDCQESWNKGDKKPGRNSYYEVSGIEFYPNQEPDEFEDKLEKLVSYVEQDREGIQLLSSKAEGRIYALIDFHRGNQLLGGMNISSDLLKRISALDLSLDFQIAAWGNGFK